MTAGLYGLFLALVMVMRLAPESGLGRWLNHKLVERPLAMISRMNRHQLLVLIVIAGFAMAGGEAMAVLGPEAVSAFAADLAIYLDAVLVTYAAGIAAFAKKNVERLKLVLLLPLARLRPRRKRTQRRQDAAPPANDDDHHPISLRLAA